MKKIHTDYKQRFWKIEAKLFTAYEQTVTQLP